MCDLFDRVRFAAEDAWFYLQGSRWAKAVAGLLVVAALAGGAVFAKNTFFAGPQQQSQQPTMTEACRAVSDLVRMAPPGVTPPELQRRALLSVCPPEFAEMVLRTSPQSAIPQPSATAPDATKKS